MTKRLSLSLFGSFTCLSPFFGPLFPCLLGLEGGAVSCAVVPGLEGCPAHSSPTELGAGLPWPAERGPRQRKGGLAWEVVELALPPRSQCHRPFRRSHLAGALEWNLTF